MPKTSDLRITSVQALDSPRQLLTALPASEASIELVVESRQIVSDILNGNDRRLIVLVGPCSIHDPVAAIEYAQKLKVLSQKISDQIFVIMRVYFEKPRTRLGWKGLIFDPDLNGTNDIQKGLRLARALLLEITAMGVPAASETLDPIVPQYIGDLLSWAAIGARTTESQTHREMASGLSVAVGFKNGTDGSVETAVNAMAAAASPHSFIGMDTDGRTCILSTSGNDLGHIILRGGKNGPNYSAQDIDEATTLLRKSKLPERIIVDCSHANSGKDFRKQRHVLDQAIRHRSEGIPSLMGCMIESNLFEGNQEIPVDTTTLRYGVSVTDPCLSWEDTENALLEARDRLADIEG